MSMLSMFFTVMWCFAKPLLFLVIPALIIGEKYIVKQTH